MPGEIEQIQRPIRKDYAPHFDTEGHIIEKIQKPIHKDYAHHYDTEGYYDTEGNIVEKRRNLINKDYAHDYDTEGLTEEVEPKQIPISQEFAHLFDKSLRIKDCQNLEIEALLERIAMQEVENRYGRRISVFTSRNLSRDEDKNFSDEKVKNHKQKISFLVGLLSATCHAAGALFGGAANKVGGSFSAIGEAFNRGASHKDSLARAKEEQLSYHTQRIRSIVSELSELARTEKSQQDAAANRIDTLTANMRRLIETILSGSS